MKTVHFTDLKDYATRDTIKRGAVYLRCHDLRDRRDFLEESDFPVNRDAFCYPIVATSNLLMVPRSHGLRTTFNVFSSYWKKESPQFSAIAGQWPKPQWHFASDSGLWNVPNVEYRNKTNYMLEVNELLRQGIFINRTTIKGATA